MYVNRKLESGIEAAIIVRTVTERRLRAKCFRGTSIERAGNFLRWDSVEDLFHDEIVLQELCAEIDDLWPQQAFGTLGLCITHALPVGWESTDSLGNYAPDDLEQFSPNRRSQGLRVKLNRTDLLAPKTERFTLIFELKPEDDAPVTIIHSIYPGTDIGELSGDVTNREKRVFFDWNHPGER